jgi:hypothetical protein
MTPLGRAARVSGSWDEYPVTRGLMDVSAGVNARGMVAKKHRVLLSTADRERLLKVIGAGRGAAQTLTHARVLLKAD